MDENKIPQNRHDILLEALKRCYDEMYRKSQPSVTWEEVNQNVIDNKYGEGVKDAYNFHYLSQEEYKDIRQKYMNMYNIHNDWKENAQLMIDYLSNGGTKDKWIPEKIHEDGSKEPGYRGYEKVPPISELIHDILKEYIGEENCEEVRDKITNKVLEVTNWCKDFYRGDREESQFIFSVMDLSPNINKDTVKENWEKLGESIEIIDKIEDPYTGEWELPENVEGYKPGLVFNYDLDEWVTPEELEKYEQEHPKPKIWDFDNEESTEE